MAFNYDKLFATTPNALGAPTQVIVDFFDRFAGTQARVLDIGCGQGRDALFIARAGHAVIGVDLSPHGIAEMQKVAMKEGLAVEGVVCDITAYDPGRVFDVVLIDRTLHMLSREARLGVLERMLDHVDADGWIMIADEASNIDDFADIIAKHALDWIFEYRHRGYLFARRN